MIVFWIGVFLYRLRFLYYYISEYHFVYFLLIHIIIYVDSSILDGQMKKIDLVKYFMHNKVKTILVVFGVIILFYVSSRLLNKSVKEGAETKKMLPSMKDINEIAGTVGVNPDSMGGSTPSSKTTVIPSGQSTAETPANTKYTKDSEEYKNMSETITKCEVDRKFLMETISMVKPLILNQYMNDINQFYKDFERIPTEFKFRIIKLATTDVELNAMITNDSVLNAYAMNHPNIKEVGQPPDYSDQMKLPLKEYFVKGSYNTVYDPKTGPSILKLKEVLFNGCRFIDLQIFSIADPKTKESRLYVAYGEPGVVPTVDASLPLSTAIEYIASNAFNRDGNMTTAMLKGDPDKTNRQKLPSLLDNYVNYPLFLMFRVHRASLDSPDIIQLLHDNYLNTANDGGLIPLQNLYKTPDGARALPVSGNTALHNLKQKIIICMDIDNILQNYTSSYDSNDVPNSTKDIMRRFVNVKTGGHTWKTFHSYGSVETSNETVLLRKDDFTSGTTFETNVKNWFLSMPSPKDSNNPAAIEHANTHKIQVSPCRYYINDANLAKYNEIFDHFMTPMVPMSKLHGYIVDAK